MSWLTRLLGADERRSITGDSSWFPGASYAGVLVTPDNAATIPAVDACVTAISTDIGSLDFNAYRRLPKGRQPVYDLAQYDLLNVESNAELSASTYRMALMRQVLLYGHSVSEIERDDDGNPLALHLLDPRTTYAKRTGDGRLYYESTGTGGVRLLPENVIHVTWTSLDGLSAISPVNQHKDTFSLALALQVYAAATFGNSTTPHGIIKYAGKYNDQAFKNIRESFEKMHRGPYNSAKVAVLEAGTDFVPISQNLKDLQYTDLQRFVVEEITRIYRVPAHKINLLDNATFSNIEEQNIDYVTSTIRPWCERLEDEFNRKLLTRSQRKVYFFQLNLNSLLRGNMAARSDYYNKMFFMGAMSRNEIREDEGLNPVEGGDTCLIPVNMAPVAPTGDPADLPSLPDAITAPVPGVGGPAPQEAINAVRDALRADLARMTRRECQALRRASRKPQWRSGLEDLYRDHEEALTEAIRPNLRAYRAISGLSYDPDKVPAKLATGSRDAVRDLDGAALEGLLGDWEGNKADWILDELDKEGQCS